MSTTVGGSSPGAKRHRGLLLHRRGFVAVAFCRCQQTVFVGHLGRGERSRREPGTRGRHRRGPAVVRRRHERGRRVERAELARRTHAFAQVAGALLALFGQVRGDRRADGLARVLFGAGAQRHEEADEAADLHQPVRVDGLTGQLEEDVHRTALPHDAPAQVDELGTQLAAEQLLVLVDDHHKARHRFQRRIDHPLLVVDVEVFAVRRRAQRAAPVELTLQRLEHALDEVHLVAEVADAGDDMRKPFQHNACGLHLPVEERDVDRLGRMGQRQRGDLGDDRLGLAGTREADQHGVHAHSVLGGLLEVQFDHFAGRVEADREAHPQPVLRAARRPQPIHVQLPGIANTQYFQQVSGRAVGGDGGGRADRTPRGQGAREPFGLGDAHRVGDGVEGVVEFFRQRRHR